MMTAVILAAGVSSRLRPLTDSIPKALLPIAGKPLLQRTLVALQNAGVGQAVVVTGYHRDRLEAFLQTLNLRLDVTLIHNPQFATTGNNYSLWLTAPIMAGRSMVLMDADILFDGRVLDLLNAERNEDALVVRTSGHVGDEEVKVQADTHGFVVRIGKDLPPSMAAGESVGIERFSPFTSHALFASLAKRKDRLEFYEASFQEIIDAGARIRMVESAPYQCMEIDTLDDLHAAEIVAKTLD
jgi:choline kinase